MKALSIFSIISALVLSAFILTSATGADNQPYTLKTDKIIGVYFCPDWCQWTSTGVSSENMGKLKDAGVSLKANLPYFNTVMVDDTAAAYSDGTIVNISVDPPYPVLTNFTSKTQSEIQCARDAGKTIWAVINDVVDVKEVDTVTALAKDDKALTAFTTNLVTFANSANVAGINIDFESLDQDASGSARKNMNKVIAAVHKALMKAGKKLMISVPAKNKSVDVKNEDLIYFWNYDYAFLAANSEYIQMMSYDQTIGAERVGPNSGLQWMKDCFLYALTFMPSTKLLTGLPAYGYDYIGEVGKSSTEANPFYLSSPKIAKNIATKNAFDGTPYVTYNTGTDKHVVFYDDAESIAVKAGLVNKDALKSGQKALAGVTIWALGGEFEGEYKAIADAVK